MTATYTTLVAGQVYDVASALACFADRWAGGGDGGGHDPARYFDESGRYLGPDQDGTEPIFVYHPGASGSNEAMPYGLRVLMRDADGYIHVYIRSSDAANLDYGRATKLARGASDVGRTVYGHRVRVVECLGGYRGIYSVPQSLSSDQARTIIQRVEAKSGDPTSKYGAL